MAFDLVFCADHGLSHLPGQIRFYKRQFGTLVLLYEGRLQMGKMTASAIKKLTFTDVATIANP